MEAVKMPSTVQAKNQVRTASTDTSKGNDDFMKLLQVKKDQVQPRKTDGKQTEAKDSQKDVEDVSQGKQEEAEDTKELVSSGDIVDQDTLLQAAMQQAAVQMAGIVTTEPLSEKETAKVESTVLEGTEDVALPLAETVSQGEAVQSQKVGQDLTDSVEQPRAEKQESDGEADQEKAIPKEDNHKTVSGVSTSQKDQEIQQPHKARTEPKAQETEGKTDNVNSVYSQETPKADTQQVFEAPKTEEVPLKTSEDTLHQDLGKMLTDRLPGAGRELVVELEPANLGKLTIKMVYEAGKAAVSIIATNPKTLEILNQKAAEIASILEEKTGQETVIYTEAPQQESQEENPDQSRSGQGDQQGREERHGTGEEKRHDAESFAQQLRLGLI